MNKKSLESKINSQEQQQVKCAKYKKEINLSFLEEVLKTGDRQGLCNLALYL